MRRHPLALPAERASQRGAAALALTTLLALAGLLVVAYTQRHVVAETRGSAHALRTAQAFEAAEAGLDWAIAQLDNETPIDAACSPSADPADRSFRDGRLERAANAARYTPVTWRRGGADVPLAAACVRGASGWRCSCPGADDPAPEADLDGNATPAFHVQVEAGPTPAVLRVVATGCLRADARCAATSDGADAAAARVETLVALLPALRRAPAAAVVVGGAFDAGVSAPSVVNPDGVALHAGGAVFGDAVHLAGAPGSPLADLLASHDAALAALDAERHFARWFGMTRAAWRGQPAATTVRCTGDCGIALATAIGRGARLVAVDGDLDLSGPLVLGSATRPIVLVATGAARWRGDIVLHGVVHVGSLEWRASGAAAAIHGALLVHRDASIEGVATISRDAGVLATLQRGAGSFVRVDGSWKDH